MIVCYFCLVLINFKDLHSSSRPKLY